MDPLVSTEWLAKEMAASDLRIVDATYFLAESGRDASAEYEAAHIPGAVFMDLGDLVDASSGLPNTLPPAEKFASRMQSLGLGDGSRIVLYDNSPLHSSARAWFMLTMFGAHGVAILDGGLAKWRAEGRDVAQGRQTLRHRHFTVWQDQRNLRCKADMLANLANPREQVVDARSAERFEQGHIPGARNVPYASLFNADDTWKSLEDLKQAFVDAGVDIDKPIVASCNSGITANVPLFALHLIGRQGGLYDGSWSEWCADADTPKETGKATGTA